MTNSKKPRSEENFIVKLFKSIIGIISTTLLICSTLITTTPLFIVAIFKIIPLKFIKKPVTSILNSIATLFISLNNTIIKIMMNIKWEVEGLEDLSINKNYLVISNHKSWVDIVVLQKIFNHKIPFLKFFLKQELIKVPILGLAWWALDYPFMKRYTKAEIEKNPNLKGKDIEITKKACEKFKDIPVSVMNFPEGSRFTEEKHTKQNSPFKHLLKPKAGGMGFVLTIMGEHIDEILNVTIVYPQFIAPTFWDFLCGRVNHIKVNIERIPITEKITGDYIGDISYQNTFKKYVNDLWVEKDKIIQKMNG